MAKSGNNNQPSTYHPTLPRVSTIVEFEFPFEGEDKDRFLSWLSSRGISELEYMEEASKGGSFVHKQMELYINTGVRRKVRKYREYVEAGYAFIDSLKEEYDIVASEKYIKCRYYQGTIDLVVRRKSDGKIGILDFKTYGLAKQLFGITSSGYKKPYKKLKKASLQLSLYGRVEKASFIGVIELAGEYGAIYHPLEMWSEDEMMDVIKRFKLITD